MADKITDSIRGEFMLYKRGEIWWTQFRISGKRYYRSTKTSDKTLAKKIEQTINTALTKNK